MITGNALSAAYQLIGKRSKQFRSNSDAAAQAGEFSEIGAGGEIAHAVT
jgi:hypothetical protein